MIRSRHRSVKLCKSVEMAPREFYSCGFHDHIDFPRYLGSSVRIHPHLGVLGVNNDDLLTSG